MNVFRTFVYQEANGVSKTYNLFISHSWAYGDAYDKLVELLNNRSYFFFKNYSVPKNDPIHTNGTDKQLYEAIKVQMGYAHVVIILAGVYSTYSRWINKEIEIAQSGFSVRKPILAVQPWGAERTSSVVKEAADLVVKWNTESIVEGIRSLVK